MTLSRQFNRFWLYHRSVESLRLNLLIEIEIFKLESAVVKILAVLSSLNCIFLFCSKACDFECRNKNLLQLAIFLLQWNTWGKWHRTLGRLRSSRRLAGSYNVDSWVRRLRLQSHHRGRIRVIYRCNSADSPGLILPPIPVSSSISALSAYTRCLIPAATSGAVSPDRTSPRWTRRNCWTGAWKRKTRRPNDKRENVN